MDVSSLIAGRKARWLVTGAAGFIGSHLAESLALAGQSVIAIDDFSTGKQANIDAIMASTRAAGQNGLQFEEGTICDRAFCNRVVEGVDYVLHQAALGSVPRSMKTPLVSFQANVSGFMEIIDAALTLADDEPGTADVFNVAASRRTTLLELAELLRKLIQEVKPDLQMPDPVFADFRPGDVRHSLADISHSQKRLGYRPSHLLEDGLRIALPWFIENPA